MEDKNQPVPNLESQPLLSESEVAELLNVSRCTVTRQRQAGRIGFIRIGTRVLYRPREVERFKAAQEELANAARAA